MIKGFSIPNRFTIKEWVAEDEYHERAMHWIWSQLMGETVKGDILDFIAIQTPENKETRLFAGLLRGSTGNAKAIIPAIYEKIENGILDTVDYTGETTTTDLNIVRNIVYAGKTSMGIDEYAFKFLQLS